jgi:hypothetical protein
VCVLLRFLDSEFMVWHLYFINPSATPEVDVPRAHGVCTNGTRVFAEKFKVLGCE